MGFATTFVEKETMVKHADLVPFKNAVKAWVDKNPGVECRGTERKALLQLYISTLAEKGHVKNEKQAEGALQSALQEFRGGEAEESSHTLRAGTREGQA